MNVLNCYTRDELKDFMLGKLPVLKSEEISVHLDQCPTCEDTVVGLEKASDTLIDLLSGAEVDSSQAAYEKNPDYDRAATAAQQVVNSWINQSDELSQRSVDQQKIGDYEIVETLARGGMGSVFRARHTRLEKEVAIKILPERKMQSPEAIARFSREMKIIGQMSHPTMVAATDAGAADGIHYLVMELVDGVDLGKLVRRCGPLDVADACELIRQSALGVQYAHEQDVVHRDVKPSNLMLANDAVVKVLDLGLATLGGLTSTVDELTTVGQLMGTLDYMSPEQCGNSQPVGPSCDIYGLGATLYKLIAGVAPYSSPENDTPLKKLRAMATSEPTPIEKRVTGLPTELVSIVNRCLADLPADRFDSAADLAAALEPLCADHDLLGLLKRAETVADQSISSVPLLNNPRSAQNHPVTSAPSNEKASVSAGGNSRRWISTAIGLAMAGLAVLGGILIYLNTTAGQLIIESDVDDVRVTVMKNDSPTKDVQVEQGIGSTKLWAGEYQIVIKGDSDQLEIENDRFVLRQGQTVFAKVTKRPRKVSSDASQVATVSAAAVNKGSSDAQPFLKVYDIGKSDHELVISVIDTMLKGRPDVRLQDSLETGKVVLIARPADHSLALDVIKKIAGDAERKSSAGAVDSFPAGEPTYESQGIEYWIKKVRQGDGSGLWKGSLKIVKLLVPRLSDERKQEIVESHLDRFKHDVSKDFQSQLAISLAPLCESDKLFDRLFDHVILRADPSCLEFNWPEKFQAKMLEELQGHNPQRQTIVVQWANNLFRGRTSRDLLPQWKDALFKQIDNVNDKENTLMLLADRFGEDPEVIEAVYNSVSSEACSSADPSLIDYLLEAKPEDKMIAIKAAELLKAGSLNASNYVHLALVNASERKDFRLLDQLNKVLPDRSWGLGQKSKEGGEGGIITGIGGGVGGFVNSGSGGGVIGGLLGNGGGFGANTRVLLIEEIEAKVSKDQGLAEVAEKLLPAIRKQFDFKFKFGEKEEAIASQAATKKLHSASNNAIGAITGVGSKFLRGGCDIQDWAETFAAAESESAKLEALQNVYELRTSFKQRPSDLALLIARGVRGLSFDYVDTSSNESLQSLAINLFADSTHRIKGKEAIYDHIGLLTHFADSLNQLNDEDAMFALRVLRRIPSNSSSRRQKVFDFAKQYQGSSNLLLRWRAIVALFDHRKCMSHEAADRLFVSSLVDESFSNRQKLTILESWTGVRPFSGTPAYTLLELVDQMEDPRELATLFSPRVKKRIGPDGLKVIALKLIARNPECLQQVHQPLLIDSWATPEQDKQFNARSNKSLLDLCLSSLDDSERIVATGGLSKDNVERAIANLKSIQTSVNDVQRHRIERVLKLIPISTELPAQIKKSLKKTFSIKKVEKLADGSSVARVRFIRIEQGERMVAVHETKEETRQRTVEGKPQSYTVSVPVTRRVSQPYSVEVPFEKDVPVPKGKDVEAAVEAFMTELKQN